MAATQAQIDQLRRMVGEVGSSTYSDSDLQGYIEAHPTLDPLGRDPYRIAATNPPTQEANPDWSATYDLHRAASDIWEEKAAAVAHRYDVSHDQQSIKVSQWQEHCLSQARLHWAKRKASVTELRPEPWLGPDVVSNAN